MSWEEWLSATASEYSALVGRIITPQEIDSEQARAAFNAGHSPNQFARLLKTQQATVSNLQDLKWKLGSKSIAWVVYLGLIFYVCGGCFGSPFGPTASFSHRSEPSTPVK